MERGAAAPTTLGVGPKGSASPCGTLWESTLCSASREKTLGRRANVSTTPAVMRCTTLAGSCSKMSMAATNPKYGQPRQVIAKSVQPQCESFRYQWVHPTLGAYVGVHAPPAATHRAKGKLIADSGEQATWEAWMTSV